MSERFARLELMVGDEGLEKLRKSRITVVGLGAVGSFALEALARSGVGTLQLIDHDKVDPSNINRQILALESTVGLPKAQLAEARVRDINPDCAVTSHMIFADNDTIPEFLSGPWDAVVDAIDSVNPKATLLEYCWKNSIPVYSSMGAARKTDPSRIRIADVMDTQVCPLAKMMRRYLRNRDVGRGINAVYSDELPQALNLSEQEQAAYQVGDFQRGRARAPMGSFPAVTGMFGLTLAQAVIRHLLSREM